MPEVMLNEYIWTLMTQEHFNERKTVASKFSNFYDPVMWLEGMNT